MKKIVFASDFAPIRHFSQLLKDDPASVYGDMGEVLRQADCAIVNLESPLHCPDGFIAKSGAAFSGEIDHIKALTAGNFRAAVLANNHTFDCGTAGFEKTRQLLLSNGIQPVGAGKDLAEARRPLSFEIDGIKAALFTISEGEDMLGATEHSYGVRPWEVAKLAEDIRSARTKYDIILVSAHCGLEYQPYPSYYVYEAFKLWSEAGADMIIGHHPHVPQGMTCFGKTPAYFSLGNFAFYQPVKFFHRKTGYFLEIEADKNGITAHHAVPYRIEETNLRLLTQDEQADFKQLFAKLSAPLASSDTAKEAWNAVLAYNGLQGFQNELEKILTTMRETPEKGAAMLRNRVTCIQHSSQWIDGMTRIVNGNIEDAPAEMVDMVKEFMKREL
jgi:poly-gamma-glutamate synthesis protein (capsule biosynthesis protein)